MPTPSLANVFSNWSKLFENFQAPSGEFYSELERAISRRGIQAIRTSRVLWSESGAVSARREYLRVQRRDRHFDICWAPFGHGYFASWWLVEKPPPRLYGVLTWIFVAVVTWLLFDKLPLRIVPRIGTIVLILAVGLPPIMRHRSPRTLTSVSYVQKSPSRLPGGEGRYPPPHQG